MKRNVKYNFLVFIFTYSEMFETVCFDAIKPHDKVHFVNLKCSSSIAGDSEYHSVLDNCYNIIVL